MAITNFLRFPPPSFLTTTTPQQHPHLFISIRSPASKILGSALAAPCCCYYHLVITLHLNSAAEVVVMAGSRGKEAFRRPLRQLKSLPRKSPASPGLFSLSSAHLSWSRHQPLTQCQSLADAELGEDVGVVSPLLVLAFFQTTSIQPR